jgi:hypothetical protein
VEYFSDVGTLLAGSIHSDSESGTHEGKRLYLRADGTLVQHGWSGESPDDFTGAPLVVTSARAAMDEWDLSECLERLQDELEKQIGGKKPKKTQEARARAERLRAMITLSR